MARERLLSICIPTYNRAVYLERILDNLAEEMENLKEEVEICVSDNASTDNTMEVLKNASGKLPLVYKRNEKNCGYDLNAIAVTMLASGKYVWYTGDDDCFLKGSVERLVEDIRKNRDKKISAIFINALAGRQGIVPFGFRDFRLFRPGELPPVHSGFAGCVCLNRELAQDVIQSSISIQDGKAYKKNFRKVVLQEFAHVYIALECMKKGWLVGIEPQCGIRVLASGSISYTKKFYLSIVIMRYVMEIKKYYPGFREYYPWTSHLRTMASLAGIVAEKPEFEDTYRAAYRAALKVFEIEGAPIPAMVLKAYEAVRRNRVVRFVVSGMYGAGRRILGKELKATSERDESILRNLPFVIADLDELIGH